MGRQAENEMATLSVPVAHGLRAEQALAQGDLEAARVLAREAYGWAIRRLREKGLA